jgi:hypothetical protein
MTDEYVKMMDDLEKAGIRRMRDHSLQFARPTDRDQEASIKAATGCIKAVLQASNWRLQGKLNYRLGYLTGKLKAYERDEDLIKLAKDMKEMG